MPRTVAPVQPYMADNSAVIKAMQAGWEMGMKMPTTAGSIMAGAQQGMQMANQYASFQDKYGADAQAAKERKAQMEELSIQQAQQQLTRGDLQTQQMQAEAPYFGVKAANDAETSTINLELARLQKTRTEAQTANMPLEINNKNTETQLDITAKAVRLGETQRALTSNLQNEADRLALSNQFSAAKTPDDFVAARASLNSYWGKYGMGEYDKLNAQYALEAKVKGVSNDPRVSGYLNTGSPLTYAGVEKSTLTYQKIGNDAMKKLNGWAETYHKGGAFQTNTDGSPVLDAASGKPVGEDWSGLKVAVTQNFQTPKMRSDGTPQYGSDGQPVYETPKVADVMANLNFVGADEKGQLVFRNSAKSSNNTFTVPAAEGNKLLDLIHARDNYQNAQDGIAAGTKTLRYMSENGKSAISPDEMIQLRKQFAKPTVAAESSNGTAAAGGGNGVLPAVRPDDKVQYYAEISAELNKPNLDPARKAQLEKLLNNAPASDASYRAEGIRLGNGGLNPSAQPAAPGAKTPSSYYSPLP